MNQKFLGNLSFLFLLNLLVKPIWLLVIEVKVQNVVGEAVYGNYFSLFNFAFILNVFLDLGINYYNNRNISRHPDDLNTHFFNIITLKSGIALGYGALAFAIAGVLGYSSNEFKLLAILMFNQVLLSFIQYFRSNLGALQLFKRDSFISILDKSLMILFCSLLIWGNISELPFDIWQFALAQTLAYVVTAIWSMSIVFKQINAPVWRVDLSLFRKIVKESYPYALLVLLMSMYSRTDSIMLERMLPNGDQQAGVYAASYRLLDAVNQFGLLFSTILFPLFSKMIKQNEPIKELLSFSARLMFVGALVVGLTGWFFGQEITQLFYTAADEEYAEIFKWLWLSFIPMSSIFVLGALLTANGNLKQLNFVAISGLVFNIGLNLFLIPQFQAIGATYATMATQFTLASLYVLLVVRVFRFSINVFPILKLFVFVAAGVGIFMAINTLQLFWIYKLVFATLGVLMLSFLLKLIEWKSMIKFAGKE